MNTDLTIELIRAKHLKQAAIEAAREKRTIPRFEGTPIPGPCRIYPNGHRGYRHPRKKYSGVMVCSGCGQAMDHDGQLVTIVHDPQEADE